MPFSYSHPHTHTPSTAHAAPSPCACLKKHLAMHRNHPHPKPQMQTSPRSHNKANSLSTHSYSRFGHCDRHSIWRQAPLTRSPATRSDNPCHPVTDPPCQSSPNRSRDPPKTHRGVLRAQNAPEPDSQSIKNPSRHTRRHRPQARHRSQTPNPAHGGHPASKTRSRIFSVTTAAQHTPASTPQPAHPSQHIPAKPWRRTGPPWRRTGSNRRPPACKAGALPTELRPLG